jgi:molybdopterin biosynthesis enzyme
MTLARLKGFEKLTNVDEALSLFFQALKPKRLKAECVTAENAAGRVIAENMVAPSHLPLFECRAVDGYAVKVEDTFETSQFKPEALKLTQKDSLEAVEPTEYGLATLCRKGLTR